MFVIPTLMEHDMAKPELTKLKFDPNGWKKSFEEEKINLLFALKDFSVSIKHIGATAYTNGRSDRNVDILLLTKDLKDIYTIQMRLCAKGYKSIEEYSQQDLQVLVKKTKVGGYGVTIRIMEYGSPIHTRYYGFMMLMKDDSGLIHRYNAYRYELQQKCGKDWKKYHELKQDYIEMTIDERCRFE